MFVLCKPFKPSVMALTNLLGPFVSFKVNEMLRILPLFLSPSYVTAPLSLACPEPLTDNFSFVP
jgi:hypothetical protein